ncbi:hypothetical protein [Pseudalkalibacillus caeni]|uniref:Uncharacterized protein n=1 Tax=Exobacillus caeni TaxID=2574798 RepID=A0A5R9F3A1_9BACL|nr:hypothetical protein [Pseudalkalibacillus caeni]TLS36969.1 hypothetical protein FCL54_13535 [Pseudalkalibacillus caeni]
MQKIKIWGLIAGILLVFIGGMAFILYDRYINETHLTFYQLDEAEKTIGKIKQPGLTENYRIQKITYDNDGFTHPVTKILYSNNDSRITFILASSLYDDWPTESIKNVSNRDLEWIHKDEEYVLKWRETKKESYKYLVTEQKSDKEWLVNMAENYR